MLPAASGAPDRQGLHPEPGRSQTAPGSRGAENAAWGCGYAEAIIDTNLGGGGGGGALG